jgi:PAS domain S-box-containing protein
MVDKNSGKRIISEKLFRQFAQHLPVPLVYGNRSSGRNEFINAQYTTIFGYTLDDVPTISAWWGLAYPDEKYRSEQMRVWEAALVAGKKYPVNIEPREARIVCKSGEVRLCIISGTITEDGVLATFIDITEKRRDEQLLMASYERKRKNDLLNDLILHDASSGKVIQSCERMLGNRAKNPFECFLLVMKSYQGKPLKHWLDRRDIYQPLIDRIVQQLEGETTIAWESADGVGILRFGDKSTHSEKTGQCQQAETVLQTIEQQAPGFIGALGVAERVSRLSELGICYRQAAVSVQCGSKIWPQRKVYHYLDIGLLQLLPYINDQKQLDNYIERTLGPVLHHDQNKKVKLLPTLEVIMLGANLKSAANLLSIHYKTLMVRKRQLEKLFGADIDDIDVRISLSCAIKLMKLRSGTDD